MVGWGCGRRPRHTYWGGDKEHGEWGETEEKEEEEEEEILRLFQSSNTHSGSHHSLLCPLPTSTAPNFSISSVRVFFLKPSLFPAFILHPTVVQSGQSYSPPVVPTWKRRPWGDSRSHVLSEERPAGHRFSSRCSVTAEPRGRGAGGTHLWRSSRRQPAGGWRAWGGALAWWHWDNLPSDAFSHQVIPQPITASRRADGRSWHWDWSGTDTAQKSSV